MVTCIKQNWTEVLKLKYIDINNVQAAIDIIRDLHTASWTWVLGAKSWIFSRDLLVTNSLYARQIVLSPLEAMGSITLRTTISWSWGKKRRTSPSLPWIHWHLLNRHQQYGVLFLRCGQEMWSCDATDPHNQYAGKPWLFRSRFACDY